MLKQSCNAQRNSKPSFLMTPLNQAWRSRREYLQVPGPGTSKGSPFKLHSDELSCFIVTEHCFFKLIRVLIANLGKTLFFSNHYWPDDSGNKIFKHLFMRLSQANLFRKLFTYAGTPYCCFWLLENLFSKTTTLFLRTLRK